MVLHGGHGMTDEKLKAWWCHRQGLDGSLAGLTAAQVLESVGWARSVGGAAPYLTLFSRAGIRRAEADAALAAVEIHELPSARGCTYVLPQRDYALGLTVGRQFAEAEIKVARKLGVTDDEIARLCEAVREALKDGPLAPDGLRAAVGDAARSLGPEGVKKGVTTTLPVALGAMQVTGDIRRVPVNGRLDQQRYKYALWSPNPLAKWNTSEAESFVALARLFFGWTGCARAAGFQTFSGLGVKASQAAMAPLGLVPVASDYLALPETQAAIEEFVVPTIPQYSLVSNLDTITGQMLHGAGEKPDHSIMDRGQMVGNWQFDPAAGEIVWTSTVRATAQLREAVAVTEAYIREDLEDFRSFSLDSPKSRAPRIQALRAEMVA